MSRLILLLLSLIPIGGQGTSPLSQLPVEEPAIEALATELLAMEGADTEAVRPKAQELLRRLLDLPTETLTPAALAGFLLQCEAEAGLPVDYFPYWAELHSRGPAVSRAVGAALLPAGEKPVPAALVATAVRLAGRLKLTDGVVLARIGGLLSHADAARQAVAREALLAITGRQFRTQAAFEAWHSVNHDRPRNEWLESALSDERDLVRARERDLVNQVRARLDSNPAAAWALVEDGFDRVRRLAYERLRSYPDHPSGEGKRLIGERIAVEPRDDLRAILVEVVPHYYADGTAAIQTLKGLLTDGASVVQVAAARTLMTFVSEPAQAREALQVVVEYLDTYVYDAEGSIDAGAINKDLRQSLLTSLATLGQDAELNGSLDVLMRRILAVEIGGITEGKDTAHSTALQAAGSIFGLEQIRGGNREDNGAVNEDLRQYFDTGQTFEVQLAALRAATRIAKRVKDRTGGTEQLQAFAAELSAAMDRENPRIRVEVIRSAAELKLPSTTERLVGRLTSEHEVDWIRLEALRALASIPTQSSDEFKSLIEYVPHAKGNGHNGGANGSRSIPEADLRKAYFDAVRFQVAGDFRRLTEAVDKLNERRDHDAAYALLAGEPLAEDDSNYGVYVSSLASTLARKVLSEENPSGALSDEAVALVRQQAAVVEAQDPAWGMLLLELALMRNDFEIARDGLDALNALENGSVAEWPLRLDVGEWAQSKDQVELVNKALQLATSVDVPAADQGRLADLRAYAGSNTPSPSPSESAVETNGTDEAGDEQGPQEGAIDEGGEPDEAPDPEPESAHSLIDVPTG